MADAPTKPRRHWIATGIYAWLGATILSAQPPQAAAAPGGEAAPDKWTITLLYGAGTPGDAGPMGHCTATFRSDGHVKIESRRRQRDAGLKNIGLKNVVVYENDAVAPEALQAIARAADQAFKEPSTRRFNPEDGAFFNLSRAGTTASRVTHYHLLEFWKAPPAMLKFVALMNELLPPQERVPLAPEPDGPRPAAEINGVESKP